MIASSRHGATPLARFSIGPRSSPSPSRSPSRLLGAAPLSQNALALSARPATVLSTPPHQTRRHAFGSSKASTLLYESPFGSLSLRLKRVSLASAIVGVIGVPMLIAYHSGDVPAIGQAAVGGTAILGATGSTLAMSFCFSPYIHTLEKVPIRQCHYDESGDHDKEEAGGKDDDLEVKHCLIKATTRNLFTMKVETVFDPESDVAPYKGIRPFCNFQAKGRPMYVHAELLEDDVLRKQLVGDVDLHPKKVLDDDDEIL